MTEIPERAVTFALPGPEYERIAWIHDEHLHGSETPLIQDAGLMGPDLARDGLPRSIFVNGYSYARAGFDIASMADRPIADNGISNWRQRWEPRIAAACETIEGFDPGTVPPGEWAATLDRQATEFRTVFFDLHMETMLVVLPAAHVFLERWKSLMGAARAADGAAMLQGFPNESTHRIAELWALSRIALAEADVRRFVERGIVPEGTTAAATAFRDRFAALLQRFGYTTTMHLQDLPTWAEDPSRPLAMVAAYLVQPDAANPRAGEAAQVARREALERELDALAVTNEDARELARILGVARFLTPVSEDHNVLGDHRLLAASRRRWLRIGGHLAARGQLTEAGDVFYLQREELVELLETPGGWFDSAVIGVRRARQSLWRDTTPPGNLGVHPEAAAGTVVAGTIRGQAASAGVYRGRARVIASLDNAHVLEPGDILVVSATGPEWVGYFGIIGALVTDVGGPLTHAAVVSREMGIPAVVGTRNGTASIPDGAQITVDGSTGTVTIEP